MAIDSKLAKDLKSQGVHVTNPHFPALRSDPMALSGASLRSKFLAINQLTPCCARLTGIDAQRAPLR